VVVIFDEASEIADVIWETIEGTLLDENTEMLWLCFGNPAKRDGRFAQCFGSQRHRWITRQIDSRQVEGCKLEVIKEWQEAYGEDSDWFRVVVKGAFPRGGFNQFIASDTVSACRRYKAVGYEGLPKGIGVDPARFGSDRSAIILRQAEKLRF